MGDFAAIMRTSALSRSEGIARRRLGTSGDPSIETFRCRSKLQVLTQRFIGVAFAIVLSLCLNSCAAHARNREAVQVARRFAVAMSQGDTATIAQLVVPELGRSFNSHLSHKGDPRLQFDGSNPPATVRRGQGQIDVFVHAAGSSENARGIRVIFSSDQSTLRVRNYELVPDYLPVRSQ